MVLGEIAETRLSQVFARGDGLDVFLSRLWALFFILLSFFSIAFPAYQKQRGVEYWARFFVPALLIVLAVPVFMMPGAIRSIIAMVMALTGIVQIVMALKTKPAAAS